MTKARDSSSGAAPSEYLTGRFTREDETSPSYLPEGKVEPNGSTEESR